MLILAIYIREDNILEKFVVLDSIPLKQLHVFVFACRGGDITDVQSVLQTVHHPRRDPLYITKRFGRDVTGTDSLVRQTPLAMVWVCACMCDCGLPACLGRVFIYLFILCMCLCMCLCICLVSIICSSQVEEEAASPSACATQLSSSLHQER